MKDRLALVAKGFCMGTADVVPGVSGGTMALILGIYPRLIDAIKSFDLAWCRALCRLDHKNILGRPDWVFLMLLFIGIACALLFFTRVVALPVLIHTHPELVYGLFFGLILGSVIMLIRDAAGLQLRYTGFILVGLVLGYLVLTMVPVQTPESNWFIFLTGAIAISAMILPGLSGSFILLMLKKYAYIFNAIGYFDFKVIIPFALGVVFGLVTFSRLLSWLLKRWYQQTLTTIIGLLIASLWIIWPFQHRVYEVVRGKSRLIASNPFLPKQVTDDVSMAAAMIVIGLLVIGLMRYISATKSLAR